MSFFHIAAVLSALVQSGGTVPVVCIDPGHPSEVGLGTRGKMVSEIRVAWQVASQVKELLQAKGVHVVLTKQSEMQFVRNQRRAEIANGVHADLMLRLHCDSSSGSGFTTYYPDRQGTANGYKGPGKLLLLSEKPIAERFHSFLTQDLKGFLKDNGLKPDIDTAVGAKHGALIGSVFSKVPVVLVEMCVLTNPHDEALVTSRAGQKRLAEALADAAWKTIRRR